jgi:hypothetical protein
MPGPNAVKKEGEGQEIFWKYVGGKSQGIFVWTEGRGRKYF